MLVQLMFERLSLYELTAMRTTLLRGITQPKYSTAEERETWRAQVDAITAELNRRNEVQA